MRRRSCLNTVNCSSGYDRFAYYDTDKYLADYLFAREKVDVTVEKEIVNKSEPGRWRRCPTGWPMSAGRITTPTA